MVALAADGDAGRSLHVGRDVDAHLVFHRTLLRTCRRRNIPLGKTWEFFSEDGARADITISVTGGSIGGFTALKILRTLTASFLALAFFGSTAVLALTTAEISGYVRDEAGHPIANASVTLASASYTGKTSTDQNGFYAFVGLQPDTYTISFQKDGYQPRSIAGVSVFQEEKHEQDAVLPKGLKTIAQVHSRSETSLVQPTQTADQYVVNQQTMEDITGTPMTIEQSQVLNALPGFTRTSGGAPTIRGGAINDLGYEMEGVDIKEPVLGLFTNNGALAGVQQLTVSVGAFDVASGNTNEGTINEIVKQGSYPGFADVALFKNAGYYYDGLAAEAGGGTKDGRFTWYGATHIVRDANVVGSGAFEPLAVGSTSNVSVNESVFNLFYRWGKDDRNQLQYFGETGFNTYWYNWLLDPSKTPYASNNQLVWASLAGGNCNYEGTALVENCGQLVADAMPPFPGQSNLNANTNYPDGENNQHAVQKIEWHHQISPAAFFSIDVSKAFEFDNFEVPWGGGAFADYSLNNASRNYGFVGTYSNQISSRHNITAGAATVTELPGYVAQQNDLSAFTFFNDWCYVKPIALTPQFGCPGTNGTPLATFPQVAYARNDTMHRNYAYVRDQWQPSSRWYVNWGLRWDNQKIDLPADAQEQGDLLNYDYGTGQYIQTAGPAIGSKVTNPSMFSPRMFATYTMSPDDVLRFGWGRYIDFAPELQVETKLLLDPSLKNCTISNGCFAPLPGYGVTNQVNNLYDQSVYDFNTYFNSQYEPVEPQYAGDYEFSWEHDFGGGWQAKVTPYFRKGTNYVVGSQAILKTLPSGAPLYGPYTWSNIGVVQSTGVELALKKTVATGLSGWLNLTYDNTMANYNSDYFPQVSYASIALNHFYHVSYAPPISATLGLDYTSKSGFKAILEVPYESGFWYGVGKKTFIYESFYPNGQEAPLGGAGTVVEPVQVPNTNYLNGAYGYYTVDPSNPGTFEHPNIIGSKGTVEGNDPGSIEAPGHAYFNLTLAQDFGPNHQYEIGVRMANLLGNFSQAVPITNPWYHNNGFGGYNANSGVNANAAYEPFQYNLSPEPYVSEPIGPERQFLFYFTTKV
jgi:hypothetical protein